MHRASVQRKARPIVLVLLLAACGSATREAPSELRDTTGLTIPWKCGDKGCGTTANAPAFETCDQATGYDVLLDRLVYICAATILPNGGSGWHAADCRAVACSSDADCAIFPGLPYTCANDVCVDFGIAVPNDAKEYLIAVCLGSTPRPTDCTSSALDADALVAKNCDATGLACSVPSTCKQP
jgi:hypothetical protein